MIKVTVLSDTHGLLRPEVLPHLAGADAILHAGDVVSPAILPALQSYAPTYAVRGNCDGSLPLSGLPAALSLALGRVNIFMLHDLAQLPVTGVSVAGMSPATVPLSDPPANVPPGLTGARVIISGHTHKPSVEERGGVLYLNPGSCGPRRFSLPVTLAHLTLSAGASRQVHAEVLTLP